MHIDVGLAAHAHSQAPTAPQVDAQASTPVTGVPVGFEACGLGSGGSVAVGRLDGILVEALDDSSMSTYGGQS